MFRAHTTYSMSIALILLTIGAASGADEPEESNPRSTVQSADIDGWIADLEHERITKRQQARTKLLESGKAAIPALAKSALSGKRETIEKSIDVLGKLAQSSDEETSEAAKITLEMLSESDQPSTADRAKIALSTKEAGGIQPFEGWDKPSSEFAGGGLRNQNEMVSVSNINGIRTIRVKRNGVETTIQEQPRGGIRVRVTGGKKPVEFVAKNRGDLKKRNPEAFAVYERYAQGNRGFANMGAFPNIGGGAFANQGGFARSGRLAIAGDGRRTVVMNDEAGGGDATKLLIQQMTELRSRMSDNPLMQQMLDQQIESLRRR